MTAGDLFLLSAFILHETGMNIPESNQSTIVNFIERKQSEFHCSLREYLLKVERDPRETQSFFNHITINETYFFREERQFSLIRDSLIPQWSQQKKELIHVWSASCSSGEEALSIYSLLKAYCSKPFHITASDVSRAMLEKFDQGIYRYSSFRKDGEPFHSLLDSIIEEKAERNCVIFKEILNEIERKNLNLFLDDFGQLPQMDLIFLRNTLIYMSPQNKEKIIDRISQKLAIGGALFLSVSETPLIHHPLLELIHAAGEVYYFQKLKTPRHPNRKTHLEPQFPPLAHNSRKKDVTKDRNDKTFPSLSLRDLCYELSRAQRFRQRGQPQKNRKIIEEMDQLLVHLENQDLELAEKILKNSNTIGNYPSLFHFFMGSLDYSRNNTSSAADHFLKALNVESSLWPARFYLFRCSGKEQNTEKQIKELKRIVQEIKHYIDKDRYEYQFMLEGFNARYFHMICSKDLEGLETRSANHGSK